MGDLDECFEKLHRPKLDEVPSLKCYQQIKFSEEKSSRVFKKTIEYFYTLQKIFGEKVDLLNIKVDLYLGGKLFIPSQLESLIKKSKKRWVMIPCETQSGNFYGLIYDKTKKNLEFFRLPGSRLDTNLYPSEKKIVSLFEEKYKLPVLQFYQAIRHEPKEGTRDYETWPVWLLYKRIQKSGTDREIIANYAMEDIVRQNKEYINFLSNFD